MCIGLLMAVHGNIDLKGASNEFISIKFRRRICRSVGYKFSRSR
jgi:hypothetical protein